MYLYLSFAQKAFRQNYVYRTNTLLYMFTAILNLLIRINIWQTLYVNKFDIEGITLAEMLTFVIINSLISNLTYSSVGNKLAEKVRTGEIGGDFTRPINLKYYLMAEQFGDSLYTTVFNILPICVISTFFVPFCLPQSIPGVLMFFVSISLGVILIYNINYALGLLSFWFKHSTYVNWFLGAFTTLFGGSAVPLWFYPSFLKKIAYALPFRFVSFEPLSIYLNKTPITDAWKIILFQLLWIGVFYLLGIFIWNKAQKVVTVQGG